MTRGCFVAALAESARTIVAVVELPYWTKNRQFPQKVISFEQTEGRQPKMVKFQTNLRGNFTLVPLNMMFGKSKTAISFA